MKWNETVASSCRYGDVAGNVWGDWNILWEDSESDYQGHASFLAEKDGRFCFYEWSYGSCSGCDTWEAEGFDDARVEQEMRDGALWLDTEEQLRNWLEMLESGNKLPAGNYGSGGLAFYIDALSGGYIGRINAIRKFLGMTELTDEDLKARKEKFEKEERESKEEKKDGFKKITKKYKKNKKRRK